MCRFLIIFSRCIYLLLSSIRSLLIIVSTGFTISLNAADFTKKIQALLTPGTRGADEFGFRIAISGDTAVIAAPSDNQGNGPVGVVYVYVRQSGIWTFQAKITFPGQVTGDNISLFGSSVAIEGNTLVIGSPYSSVSTAPLQRRGGAAYVYTRNGEIWTLRKTLSQLNPYAGDDFGGAVAIEGNTIVVSAKFENGGTKDTHGEIVDATDVGNALWDRGAVYVFTGEGATWTQSGYLREPDSVNEFFDRAAFQKTRPPSFGHSIAIENGTIVVGAPGANRGVKIEDGVQVSAKSYAAGAVYTFNKQGAKWKQTCKLTSSSPITDEEMFGESIGLSGGTLVVGAPAASTGVSKSGAAYVYTRGGGGWVLQSRLQAANADPGDRFGFAVAIAGRVIWVGAPSEAGSALGIDGDGSLNDKFSSGAVYVFEGQSGLWTQKAYIKKETVGSYEFGKTIVLSGKEAVLGFQFSGEAFFYSSERPKPVVFIPGVAGSVLRTGEDIIWPTILPTNVAKLNLNTGPANTEAIDVVREYDIGDVGLKIEPVYDPFIRYMTTKLGHREFPLDGHRDRLTSDYMTSTDFPVKPTFFVFPYDWRKPNASHMATLRLYIQHIRQLHGGEKVNLVVHSMGGLVMRRYLLEYGNEDIDKVITIGSPVWGAPEVSHRMLTGNFFGVGAVDFINNRPMKDAIATMTAVHELLPSPLYLQHWGFPLFKENNLDFNNNGLSDEAYDTSQFRSLVDSEAPFATPSASNMQFHAFDGGRQDDWSADDSLVKFLHILGKQAVDKTTVGIEVESRTFRSVSVASITPYSTLSFNKVFGEGDGTVPTLSSQRLPQYLPPGALVRAISEPLPGIDSDAQPAGTSAEHTGLMSNHQMLSMISEFLESGSLMGTSSSPIQSGLFAPLKTFSLEEPTLLEALDSYQDSLDTSGDDFWIGQTEISHDGVDAVRSGSAIGLGQESTLSLSLSGPGTFSIWAKTLSANGNDELRVQLDGVDVSGAGSNGGHDWRKIEIEIPENRHDLIFTHIKFDEPSAADGIWLDEMIYTLNRPSIAFSKADGEPLNHLLSIIDFGSHAVGEIQTINVQITNEGNLPLTDIAVSVAGVHGADFTLGSLPSTLQPGISSPLTVTYNPLSGRAFSRTAKLILTSNDTQHSEIEIGLTAAVPSGRRKINVFGSGYLDIIDGDGIRNTRLSDIAAGKIPGVEVAYGGEEPWVSIETDAAKPLTLSDGGSDAPLEIEILETDAVGLPLFTWRYRFEPDGRAWTLGTPTAADPILLLDQNNDNALETSEEMAAIHSATGTAVDLSRPSITLQISKTGNNLTLAASGTDTGVSPILRYSIDGGQAQTYQGPLSFSATTIASIKIFAEDASGNTSGLIETAIQPALAIGLAAPSTLELRWPQSDAYILQESTDLLQPWTRSTLKATNLASSSMALIPLGQSDKKFYRLLANPITR